MRAEADEKIPRLGELEGYGLLKLQAGIMVDWPHKTLLKKLPPLTIALKPGR